MEYIKLKPYNAILGKQSKRDVYLNYLKWRKSEAYKFWLKLQWSKQKGTCFYCKTSLKGRRHNVEHVNPISRYGQNNATNLVLSCAPCNKEKNDRKPTIDEVRRARILAIGKKRKRRSTKRSGLLKRAWNDYYVAKSHNLI